ncbi:MAG: hypothetical protein PHX61_12745 [Alphaproteobacteria bacterium]|nr:hypothetical protein [Alphaproteobacteria bacterium]
MKNLKAWTQDPEDWKITCTPKPKKKTLLQKLEPWLITIGLIAYAMLCNALVEAI